MDYSKIVHWQHSNSEYCPIKDHKQIDMISRSFDLLNEDSVVNLLCGGLRMQEAFCKKSCNKKKPPFFCKETFIGWH